ncbi:MAG: GNAT family N-acetyltransferase [Gemmatimonadetes bacterium]|nr:GNAT family N-acetyltransferase [Gemmatimonadota bacterium]
MSAALHAGVTVRVAVPADAAALAAFGARTFAATYEHDNDPAHTAAHLARTFTPERQLAEITDPGRVMLLAEVDGELASYALVHVDSPAPVTGVTGRVGELERIYVDSRWHGRGLADAMMDAILEHTAQAGVEALWLAVWEKNARAIRFYERRGFREAGTTVFMYGNDPQNDRVMVRHVRDRRGPAPNAPAKVARPVLTVRLQRGRDGRDLLVCVRADGTTSWVRRPHGMPRRDRALLALEGTLALQGGVFAQVAAGAELLELLRPERADDAGPLGWSLRFAGLLDAEAVAPRKAGLAMVEAAVRGPHADVLALDDAMLTRVRAAAMAIEAAWHPLPADTALEFAFAPGVPDGLGAPLIRRATGAP